MSNNTVNSSPLIRSQVFSKMIQEILYEELIAFNVTMDASEFGDGTTFNIPSIGDCVVRDISEDVPVVYDPINTGNFQLSITDFNSAATYVTGKLKEDGYQAAYLEAAIPRIHSRVLMERYETRLFAVANSAQTAGNANTVNSQSHRLVGSGTSNAVAIADFAKIKASFDKAYIPGGGRVMFVDPLVSKDLGTLVNIVNVINNPKLEGVIQTGMSRERKFIVNLYGIDIYESNRLPTIASETIGSSTVTNGVANIAMCVIDDDVKPMAMAWRRKPVTKGDYNKDMDRDEYVTYARFGLGVKRLEALAILLTNVTNV